MRIGLYDGPCSEKARFWSPSRTYQGVAVSCLIFTLSTSQLSVY